MKKESYPSDLTDAQWEELEPLLPLAKPGGRPRTVEMHQVINGILYILRSVCSWRMMPHDLPPWRTAWGYFRRWRKDGNWEWIHDALPPKVRELGGREPTSSAAVIASQSVKTPEKGGLMAMMLARK